MKLSRKEWSNYVGKLSMINQTAGRKMREWIERHGTGDIESLVTVAYALTTKYGEAASATSCAMYDAIAHRQKANVPPAEPKPTQNIKYVDKAIRGTLERTPDMVPETVSEMVKRTGSETTLKNAKRDGAYFAWVPNGDTCPFCITLASNGWRRASKKTIEGDHADHIHKNCDCEFAINFGGPGQIEGYDPDKYLEMYNNAEGDTWQDKVNSMRRADYAANKDKINEQKRAAYAKRMEAEESNRRRKALNQETLVEHGLTNSGDYKKKIDELSDDIKESRAITQSAKQILAHRDGTNFEDLAFYDTVSGKLKINKSFDFFENGISACKPNKLMEAMLKKAGDYTIVGIHNHPKSGAPSIADIITARDRKYKYGIVLGHNGVVYKYSVSKDFSDMGNGEFFLEKLERAVYNKDGKRMKDALDSLSKIGIKMEVR